MRTVNNTVRVPTNTPTPTATRIRSDQNTVKGNWTLTTPTSAEALGLTVIVPASVM
jgi:hypothetical protein